MSESPEVTAPVEFENDPFELPVERAYDHGSAPAPVAAKALNADSPDVPNLGTKEPEMGTAAAEEAETVTITDAQLRAHLEQRVADAEALLERGRKTEAEGKHLQSQAMEALRNARRDFHRYFPPATFSENVKDYIEASNAERAARVAARGRASQLDLARMGGNARGWGRGHARGAFSRKEAAALGFKLPSGQTPGVKA